VVAVLVEDVLKPLLTETVARKAVGAVYAVLDLREAEPRAQVLLSALVRADYMWVTLKLLGRVRQPVAVVRVLREVAASETGEVARTKDTRLRCVRISSQVARRRRAIQGVYPNASVV
jgi:hypothetical protein